MQLIDFIKWALLAELAQYILAIAGLALVLVIVYKKTS